MTHNIDTRSDLLFTIMKDGLCK